MKLASTVAVLPSYDVQTRVTQGELVEATVVYVWISFGFTILFCTLEVMEISWRSSLQRDGRLVELIPRAHPTNDRLDDPR